VPPAQGGRHRCFELISAKFSAFCWPKSLIITDFSKKNREKPFIIEFFSYFCGRLVIKSKNIMRMKQRILLLMLLAACCIGVHADQVETLIVKLKNGSEAAFFLKDKPQVKFEGTNLVVTSAIGDAAFPLADVLRFTYAKKDPAGINDIVTDPTGVTYQDDVLTISQLKANATVDIFSLDGKLLRQLKAHHAGTYRINLSELPSGLYLVRADNVTYKITKR